ncbi:MAG: protein-export chaperone SecB [Pseudomonadota bacterium]
MSNLQLRLERIYLKDSSFESPGSPLVFGQQWNPNFQVDINSTVNVLSENRVEVVLMATVKATLPEAEESAQTAFIAEVQQAGVFAIEGGDAESRRRVLGTACPNMLFPYVRAALDDLIVRGSFPAIQISPVNFDAVFQQAEEKRQQDIAAAEAERANSEQPPH